MDHNEEVQDWAPPVTGKPATNDPAAAYTERTGRYLSLSERMAERSAMGVDTTDVCEFA